MEIRRAKIEDLGSIQKLNKLLFEKEIVDYDETLSPDWTFSEKGTDYYTRKISGDDSFAAVASAEGEIVGYLVGGESETYSFRTVRKLAELENMLVLDECRGQGIGSQLVRAFMDWCKEKGFERVKVIASAGNSGGINFYKKHGFAVYDVTLEAVIE